MNYNIYFLRIFGLAVMMSAFISCSDEFLEVTPKGSLIAQSMDDYDMLLEDPALRELSNITVPMGDEVVAIEPFFSTTEQRTRRLFRWEDDIYNSDQNSQELQPLMASLYAYNKIINEVLDSEGGTEERRKELQAEARVGRAMNYFILINYYGKPYNPMTASSDLGFPIIEYSDISSTDFTRNTVEEVYNFIIKDIEMALPNLPQQVTKRARVSRAAAEGLLGKVLMFQQKFEQALEHLELCLYHSQNTEIEVGVYDYNIEFLDGGVFTPASPFFGPAAILRTANKEVIYDRGFVNSWSFFLNEFVISAETADLFGSSDLRLNFYSNAEFFGFEPFYPNGMLRKQGPSFQQAGVYLPDIQLLIIEAKARLGQLGEASIALQDFRSNRMPEEDSSIPTSISADQYELVKFIFEERLREFAMTGYRWFDMRRLSVDTDYNDLIGYGHETYNGDGELLESYTLTEERLVLRFGGAVTSQNPNLTENP
ncbi:RagB/SusD family nutrient uptake outer membrane protein [Maribacter sp. X9]|uniref:RagB/SusD family nutrient uptake outer membrane protein n=1 Tax=Maribacter sp. X9 TaxID=3402159 RepID=UPI003AF360E2